MMAVLRHEQHSLVNKTKQSLGTAADSSISSSVAAALRCSPVYYVRSLWSVGVLLLHHTSSVVGALLLSTAIIVMPHNCSAHIALVSLIIVS